MSIKQDLNKILEHSGSILPVMESFYTIQGEGFFQGHAAYFIRLAGCDVGCHWCDVKESWEIKGHPVYSVEEIAQAGSAHPGRVAVITGGEPLIYPLEQLTESLKKFQFRTHIETSGAYPLSGNWDWICLSPKKFKAPHQSVIENTDELKIIVFNKSDFDWAEQFARQVKPECKLYLQPEWSKQNEVLPLIIEYVKSNPQWNISLQIHKFMNIP
ncbi:organic radical activating enzyme [Sporocytophaga myxococcoides]|uniref:7-carboxy-7-deazaguanine synthase n=1 Tax=Sporocytophaga myxococcoides TaxID=153721 RepID=A0A098LMT0_9BACT|nr:7-carboxy-7-deazaguanine synthase QueE [Sporocytophaga myxococcoides]GAL87423.1 organic radical activating enzyme [Sporocytophaga myxococcoides]